MYQQLVAHKNKASLAEEKVAHIEQRVGTDLEDIKAHYEDDLRFNFLL